MQPLIIDDFIPEMYQKSIKDLLLGPEFSWIFAPYSVSQGSAEEYFHIPEPHKEHIQFRHIFVYDGEIKSEWFKFIVPLLAAFESTTGKKIKSMYRIKANLLMPQSGTPVQQPHIDGMDLESGIHPAVGKTTLLYYVDDADGDTVLYNEYFTGEPIGELTKQQSVTPVKGRAIIFDSNQLHAGCCPVSSDYRLVINFVLDV